MSNLTEPVSITSPNLIAKLCMDYNTFVEEWNRRETTDGLPLPGCEQEWSNLSTMWWAARMNWVSFSYKTEPDVMYTLRPKRRWKLWPGTCKSTITPADVLKADWRACYTGAWRDTRRTARAVARKHGVCMNHEKHVAYWKNKTVVSFKCDACGESLTPAEGRVYYGRSRDSYLQPYLMLGVACYNNPCSNYFWMREISRCWYPIDSALRESGSLGRHLIVVNTDVGFGVK